VARLTHCHRAAHHHVALRDAHGAMTAIVFMKTETIKETRCVFNSRREKPSRQLVIRSRSTNALLCEEVGASN
jgi:hypothetical protein